MNWLEEVQIRIKRKNQLLFSKDSLFLDDLNQLIKQQNHRTLVLWALELANEAVQILAQRFPSEHRLELAVHLSRDWALGKANMTLARHAILQAHAVAKDLDSLEDIAMCHAIGQACSVVHTSKHALGFPIYELTAIIRRHGIPECEKAVEDRKQYYMDRINYWSHHYNDDNYHWADFMKKI
ncbi:MAG: hypothetical protein KGZ51_00665 [Erysipelothrix sp.]|jgi:hypothetical protein|nr:hypothetical protein [Erysipelothrix sp.]